MVSLVWQVAAFLFGLLAAAWLLFVIGTILFVLVKTIVKHIKKS